LQVSNVGVLDFLAHARIYGIVADQTKTLADLSHCPKLPTNISHRK
jgi:hypothetical protein